MTDFETAPYGVFSNTSESEPVSQTPKAYEWDDIGRVLDIVEWEASSFVAKLSTVPPGEGPTISEVRCFYWG